jgi:hypothetical protein
MPIELNDERKQLISGEDLETLFPNAVQRVIFQNLICDLINFVLQETQVKGWRIVI